MQSLHGIDVEEGERWGSGDAESGVIPRILAGNQRRVTGYRYPSSPAV